jgi:hypothetical protein
MAGPLKSDARDLGAPTINAKYVDGGARGRQCQRSRSAHHQQKKRQRRAPWEAVLSEIQERPPSIQKMSKSGPLEGDAGDPGAPTINAKNVDDEPPRR